MENRATRRACTRTEPPRVISYEPLGPEATLGWGSYFVLLAPRAGQRRVVQDFLAWLAKTVRQDEQAMRG